MVSYGNDPRSLFGRVTGNIHREKVVNGFPVPKSEQMRIHKCPSCGLVMDRDHNAAINILNRGITTAVTAGRACMRDLRRGPMNQEALEKEQSTNFCRERAVNS